MTTLHFDDPVAAYDRLVSHYGSLSRRRERYLRTVEKCILARIPYGSSSLLDIGAGDGRRALHVAMTAGIGRIALVEPSAGMRKNADRAPEVWPVRAEHLDQAGISEKFDVITCMWNSLGHVPTAEKRVRALQTIANLLSHRGVFFLDVIHRYNVRSYGLGATAGRWLRDTIFPHETNGDVVAKWALGESSISTYGHVFTHREIKRLARATGLGLQERVVVDYETGELRKSGAGGNLLYVLKR